MGSRPSRKRRNTGFIVLRQLVLGYLLCNQSDMVHYLSNQSSSCISRIRFYRSNFTIKLSSYTKNWTKERGQNFFDFL